MLTLCDPKTAFEQLHEREKTGKVEVKTEQPAKAGDYLTLTVTLKDAPNQREVYEVNPATKLAERVIYYGRQGDRWSQAKIIEYQDYNKPIDPKVFDPDLPKDVMIIDQIKQKPGLEKGNQTDEQIAVAVARAFFEALIVKDYEKAGRMYGGIPAAKIEAEYGRMNVSHIVETGKPVAGVHPDPTAYAVPVKVECGARKWVQEFTPQIPLTDNDTAMKASREFLEAMIRQDGATARRALEAGLVFEGFNAKNADKLKELFEQYKVLRIVEVGKPTPHSESNRLEVPVKVELELTKEQVKEFRPFVRPVYNQPDRWEIIDGI
jgi:hypothetical protein